MSRLAGGGISANFSGWDLAWGVEEDEEKRLLLSQFSILAPMLLLCMMLPLLPLFQPPEEEIEEVEPPPRLARLLVQKPPPPPPPPPRPRAEVKAATPKPAPRVAESRRAPTPRAAPTPQPARPTAREQAAAALSGVSETLSTVRDRRIASDIDSDRQLSGATGARDDNAGAVLAANASQGSGGIGEDRTVAPATGNTALAGRQTTTVAGGSAGTAGGGNRDRAGVYDPQRSSESIQLVIDRNKNAFDRLYARALRSNPSLGGTVILRFTIAPAGNVTRCEVVSSELNNAELENKLVARFKLLDFGAQEVPSITVEKPLTFYPR